MENIRLKGAKNIRDFGGIVNKDGKKIRPHLFIRSSSLNRLTEKDIAVLTNEYRLKRVIDLRTDYETAEKPDVQIEGVENLHIPVLNNKLFGISHEQENKKVKLSDMPLPDMRELYRTIVSNPYTLSQLKAVFEEILKTDGSSAVLWHCSEGKDRCGITSALLLCLLDVDMKTVFEDYIFTNRVAVRRSKKYYRLVRIFKRDKELAEKVGSIFIADEEYLKAAFDEIEKRWGSVDGFFEAELGITPEMRLRLKEIALV